MRLKIVEGVPTDFESFLIVESLLSSSFHPMQAFISVGTRTNTKMNIIRVYTCHFTAYVFMCIRSFKSLSNSN